MLTRNLVERLYGVFEQVVAQDRFGYRFQNQFGNTIAQLPEQYLMFVSAKERYLPNDWELFSFFGHTEQSLDHVQRELVSDGLSNRWLLFGKAGDEDFLFFDRASVTREAVLWCDADDTARIESLPPYAPNFAAMIAKVTRSMALAQRQGAEKVLSALDQFLPSYTGY